MLTHDLVSAAIAAAMRNERLPPPALAEVQDRRWRELARHARRHSPYYARLYAEVDLDRARLADLPTVNKPALQAHFDEVVTDRRVTLAAVKEFCGRPPGGSPWLFDAFAVLMSSGTSGERGYFVIDGAALADAIATGFRQSNRGPAPDGPPLQQRIAAVMLIEPFDAAGLLMRLIPESVGAKRLIDIRGDSSGIVAQLNEFQPTLLSSFPYMLRLLAEAVEDGRLRIAPQRITSSGDVLTASDRATVRRAFGREPYDYYCSTEVPYIAWECDAHDGLHVNADVAIVESVDVDNRPVPAGTLGARLLLTNLSNRALPLIRYEMSDQVEYRDDACSCGSRLPRIRTVAGRVEHTLSLPGAAGSRISLIPEHIDEYVGGLPGLKNYQVIQEESARLTVNYIPQDGAAAETVGQAVLAGLRRCFERYGAASSVQLDLRRVDRLEPIRTGSTKVCHFWNRWGRAS